MGATIYFTGFAPEANTALTGGDYLLSPGVEPSTCLLRVMAAARLPLQANLGDLRLTDGQRTIRLKNCALQPGSLYRRHDDGAPHNWELRVFDRRWKWQFPMASFSLNKRRRDGSIDTSDKVSARDFAKGLFELLGEDNVDVDVLPGDVYPEYVRTDVSVAQTLRWLCDRVACRPGLKLDDKAAVWAIGDESTNTGPAQSLANSAPYYVTATQRPKNLRVVGGAHWFQTKFLLEAVGLDTDGTIKRIDDLTYKPSRGWGTQHPHIFADVEQQFRHLALESVYRWYRIKEETFNQIPHNQLSGVTIAKRWQVLPIYDFLIDPPNKPPSISTEITSFVEGRYWPQHDVDCSTASCVPYRGEFTVDGRNGIVKFAMPVFRITCGSVVPAVLYWTGAHRVLRYSDAPGYLYFADDRALSGDGDGDYPIEIPELFGVFVGRYNGCTMSGGTELINEAALRAESKAYLDAHERRWEDTTCYQQEYCGVVPLDLDGRISQIHWRVGDKTAPMTTVSSGFLFDGHYNGHSLPARASEIVTADTR